MSGQAGPTAAHGAEALRPKVLYVMGAGRSGSTILGVALGNCEGVFFAGELDRWLARAGVPRDGQARARFWDPVRVSVATQASIPAAKTPYMERSSVLLDPRKWPIRRRLRRTYRRASEELYRAVAQSAGVSRLVDTSHYPLRAREMQALDSIELYLLFLVRDPASVVASLGRRDVRERRFATLPANAYLWLTHLLALPVFMRHPRERRMFLRYEDLLAHPDAVLREILDRFGSSAPLPDLEHLDTGVPFHGNRLLDSGLVALESQPARTVRVSPLTRVLQLPWRAAFALLRPAIRGEPRRPAGRR